MRKRKTVKRDEIPAGVIKGSYVVIGENVCIGEGSAIWNFVYIGSNVSTGKHVRIGSLVHIGSNVMIGEGTLIEGCVYISELSQIGKNCFIGPNVTITNDAFPPIRKTTGVAAWQGVIVEDEAIIGGGASLRAGVRIGRRAVVGMGSVVLSDVPPETVVAGVPARTLYTRSEFEKKQRALVQRPLSK